MGYEIITKDKNYFIKNINDIEYISVAYLRELNNYLYIKIRGNDLELRISFENDFDENCQYYYEDLMDKLKRFKDMKRSK